MKRMLSLLLAIAMLVGLLPSLAFATETATQPEAFTVDFSDFNLEKHGKENLTDILPVYNEKYPKRHDVLGSLGYFYGEDWTFYTTPERSGIFNRTKADGTPAAQIVTYYETDSGNYFNFDTYAADIALGYHTVGFDIEVPAAGYYDITAKIYAGSNAGNAEVSIAGSSVGTVDLYCNKKGGEMNGYAAAGPNTVEYGKNVYLNAGTNRLDIKNTVHGTNNRAVNGIYSFTFTPAAPVKFDSVTLSYDQSYIPLSSVNGEKLTLSAKYSDGNPVDLEGEGVTVTFTSSSDEIATVDKNGVVTPKAAGDVTITASVTVGTVKKEASLELKVKEILPTDAEEFTINFSGAATEGVTDYDPSNSYFGKRWYVLPGDTLTGDNWTVLTDSEASNILKGGNQDAIQYYSAQGGYIPINAYPNHIGNGYDTVAIKFTVPETGVYEVSSDVYGSGNGGYAEVSIDGRSLGTKCLNSAAIGAAKQTVDFDRAIHLTQGEHTLSIKNSVYTGKSKAGNGFFSFTFTPGAALDSVSLTYDKEFILLNDPNGEKLTLSAKYLNLADVELDVIMEDAKVSYKSSDENIATVTADGVVMPKAEGKVTITASVTIENVTKEASVDLIIEDLEYENAVFTTEQTVFYIGSENEIFATSVLSDGTLLEQSEVVCTFTSDNTEVAVFEGNVLKALAAGITNMTANVTFNGETKSVTVEIEVVPVTSFMIDFDKVTSDIGKLTPASGGYTTHAIKVGNEFYGENWKMLTDAENSKIFANEPDAALKLAFYGAKYINITKTKEDLEAGNDTLSFEFTSPISGTFNVGGEMYFGQSGGVAEMFIDGKSVGSYDSNKEANSGAVTRQPVNFGKSIAITEGTHRLTIKSSVHTGAATVANGFYTVKFNPAGDLDSVTLSHNKDYILLSDKNGKKLKLSAKHVTGTELNLESDGVDVRFESSNADIATVDENGVVKPVSAGNVTITAFVTVNGITKEDRLTLKINDSAYDKAEIDVVRELFFEGGTTEISATGILSDGTRLEPEDVTVRFESDNTAVATVEGNILSTIKEGTANITAYVTFNEIEKSVTKEIKVVPVDIARIEAKTEDAIISLLDADGSKLVVTGINNDGSTADITGTEFTYEALTPELVTVDENGNVRAIGRGPAEVEVTANLGGVEFKCVANVVASSEKTEPTLFTYEMRENALENIAKNDWAMDMKKAAVKEAEYWLENYEAVYDSIMYEGIPRTHSIGLHDGPENFDYKCAYCNEDIRDYTTPYAWGHNPLTKPFKIQCPACNRTFPSNDFGKFYKLGLDQKRQFNRLRALDAHRAMLLEKGIALPEGEISEARRTDIANGLALTNEERAYFGYGVEGGYLYNSAYPDAVKNGVIVVDAVYDETGKIVKDEIRVTEEMLSTYAVDDGMGWDTGLRADSGLPIMKTFIAQYHHQFYSKNGETYLSIALPALMDAYLYTGDIKYGRAGAILIDRMADVYPSFDLTLWPEYQNSHGGRNTGKIIGAIWECGVGQKLAEAYDAFYPAMDDPQVIAFLSKKAAEFGLENPKTSGDLIRENCDTGLLREILKAAREDKIQGNFGSHQETVAKAAVALDTNPETSEMIEWLEKPMTRKTRTVTKYGRSFKIYSTNGGGEMLSQYVNDVDRDGFGYEIGAGYNQSWVTNSLQAAEVLYRYEKHTGFSPYDDPKYRKMFNAIYQMTMAGNYTLQLGDTDRTASPRNLTSALSLITGYKRLENPLYARMLYALKDGNLDGVYIDIFEKNAGGVQEEVEAVIEKYGEYQLGSRNLTGFGLAVLSGGEIIKSAGATADADFRRDTWMYYGISSQAHAHYDKLQMGIDAYGFNFTPDLGYPKETGADPNRVQWVSATISHNTVLVDAKNQNGADFGYPYHYDGDGQVKLIDVDAPAAYDATDIYRRTLVSVDASPEVAYTVDFFRVRGGKEHIYSFHTQSADGVTTDDLNLVPQVDEAGNYVGSYAGATVRPEGDPGGNPPNNKFPIGYAWLYKVRRDTAPKSGNFSVNFKQTDFKKQVKDSKGLNLKFTALNDWTPSSVGFAVGDPPKRIENAPIPYLDYMLIHRTGRNLDTLFTSVIQPYKGEEYIESMEAVPLTCNGKESKDDASRAVKVKLKSGRTDYIIYTTNNGLTYTLTDGDVSFDFNGFVGVYSVNEEGKNIYSYVNDGTQIGDVQAEARYTGKVKSFTQELVSENEIVVTLDRELTDEEVSALVGEYVYIDSDGADNAVYKIEGASGDGNVITLDIGDVTTVRSFVSAAYPEAGYIYNLAEGSKLYIPLSVEKTDRPVITPQKDITASAESSVRIQISAESADAEQKIAYIGTIMPRGASIDSETGIITWKPTSSQIGENGFLITVRDESGRENSISFEITVYGSTGGGAGGSGNAGTPAPSTPSTPTIPPTQSDEKDNTAGSTDNVGDGVPDVPQAPGNARFIDLGNHAWAADAINSLADDGIIKGTSENTFSPASNITRADFAILLVRAFELASENEENFADVNASDYFAKELAVARNTGLVNGIGENKFAPRNNITRQDMMVIVYRALKSMNKLDVGDGVLDVPQASDFDQVADYAKEAVSALVNAELVNGKSGRVAPTDNTTRAEVAVLLKRILDFIK